MAAKVMPSSTPARALLALVLVASASGCGFFRRLAGNDTISLEKAEVKSMAVDLRRQQKTICPREPVQMAVFAEVVLEGDKSAKQLETWAGHDANKNDKLDFVDFAFHSEQGKFDRDGWFAPNPNLLATAGKEFEIRSVFKRRPDKFSFTTTYKPDYSCITGAGGSASPGAAAATAARARPARTARRLDLVAGGAGGDGGSGRAAAPAATAPGPRLAFATVVKTPFYDRLVAISLEGDTQDFLLVPEGQPVTLRANGGAGGSGGHGGAGGQGGRGGGGNPGGAGGKGGQGGPGGNGGNGGPGGTIDLVYDARFSDLASQIRLDVSGGSAGSGGGGGHGGGTGPGGSGMTPSGSSGQSPPQAQRGSDGSEGAQGSSGNAGRQGPPGRAAAKPGDVKDKFHGSAEITIL